MVLLLVQLHNVPPPSPHTHTPTHTHPHPHTHTHTHTQVEKREDDSSLMQLKEEVRDDLEAHIAIPSLPF